VPGGSPEFKLGETKMELEEEKKVKGNKEREV